MMRAGVYFALSLLVSFANLRRVDAQFVNDTVSELDVRFFAGEWFEVRMTCLSIGHDGFAAMDGGPLSLAGRKGVVGVDRKRRFRQKRRGAL